MDKPEGPKLLALAVIKQALKDSFSDKDTTLRDEARSFLCGYTPQWRSSLETYCIMAGCSTHKIINKAREWDKKGWPIKIISGNCIINTSSCDFLLKN